MKLTVVIPAYNIQDYIGECIASCYGNDNISLNDFEIIVINDGSTDKTKVVAESYCKKHSNLRVITRTNGGLSAARNTGIHAANGDYIWFVDGDDYLNQDSIGFVLNDIDKYKCNILTYGYNIIMEGVETQKVQIRQRSEVVNSNKEFLSGNFNFPMLVWTHIYNRKFIIDNELEFCEGIIHEDVEYKFRSHFPASSVLLSDKITYNYRVARAGSIMANTSKNPQKSIDSNSTIISRFLDYSDRHNVPTNIRHRYLGDLSLLALERIFDQNADMITANKDNIALLCSYLWCSGQMKRKIYSLICYCLPIKITKFLQHFYQKHRKL